MTIKKRCDCPTPAECKHPYAFKFKHGGQRYRESTHTANYKLAIRIANKRRNEIVGVAAGVLEADVPSITLQQLTDRYLTFAKGDHPLTADTKDALTIARLLEVLEPALLISQIGVFELERWRTERAKHVSRQSVNREYIVVRAMFRQAREWKLWPSDKRLPTEQIRKWKTDEAEVRILDAGQIARALQGLEPRYALMCRITLECLPRISEVLGLRRSDIGPTWLSRRLKGGKRKRAAISPELARDLQAQFLTSEQVYVFGDPPPQQRSVSCALTRRFRRLKLDGISHHAFRHTGVTMMLENGVNPRAIQELAGWSSLQMLQRYGHVRDAEMRRAVQGNAALIRAALAAEEGTSGAHKGPHAQTADR
jgi:integrase